MKQSFLLLAMLAATAGIRAQTNDKKKIENLCGCFDVDFKYAETFSPDKNYKFHDRERLGGTELVIAAESSDKKYVLQHLLVMDDSIIIKHWREDWEYESPVLFTFKGNKHWAKETLNPAEVKNKWTQTVWEVDDAPRYQGVGEWITADGKTYWESTTDAPLPRREYTVRNDYNILKRGNRVIITGDNWKHEQDNQKIRRTDGKDTLVAEEKGINAYTRIDASKCEKAREWWQKNGAFWNQVRAEWGNYLKSANAVDLKPKVDNKRLDAYFTDLFEQWNAKKISQQDLTAKLRSVITMFASASATADTAGKGL